jgi:hypothetical protein
MVGYVFNARILGDFSGTHTHIYRKSVAHLFCCHCANNYRLRAETNPFLSFSTVQDILGRI